MKARSLRKRKKHFMMPREFSGVKSFFRLDLLVDVME